MKRQRIIIFIVGLILGTTLVWVLPVAKRRSDVMGKEAGSFQATAIHQALTQQPTWLNVNRPLTADDLKGRIILVDFWTFCCINCMHVIPELHALEKEFGDDLTVIGVHSGKFANEKGTDNIREAILRYDIEHAVVNDADFKIWQAFGVNAWPTLVVIGPAGTMEAVYSGEGHLQELRRVIARLQAKYDAQLNRAPFPSALERMKEAPALLSFPGKLEYAADRNLLFISDSGHHRIVGATLDGKIELVIGIGAAGHADGNFSDASFNHPQGLLYDKDILYIADTENHVLRRADLTTKKVTTLAGTGVRGEERVVLDAPARKTPLASPWDLAFYRSPDDILIAMAGTHQLWSYSLSKQTLSVVAGNGLESIGDGVYPVNSLSQPSGLAAYNGKHYFVDSETSSLRVLEDGRLTTLVGTGLFDFGFKDGKGTVAEMQHPIGVFADASGVYIADTYNHAIRHYDVASQILSTVATGFREPNDVLKIGDQLFVADTNNNRIRVIDLKTKALSTFQLSPSPTTHADISCEDDVCHPRFRPPA